MVSPAALIAATLLAAAFASPASAAGLDAYLWKDRPVVVFAPSREAPAAAEQIRRLAAARAVLAERDMPVLLVTRTGVAALAGRRSPTLEAAELRAAYGVGEDDFAVVLVGKDGGEKLRSAEPVTAERLTGLVDSMPMRRREAR